jgi:hypothetical protein
MARETSLRKSQAENEPGEKALIPRSAESDLPKLVQVTTYIREDQALALEMIQLAEQQKSGQQVDQAELFQEALDLLIKAHLIPIKIQRDPIR